MGGFDYASQREGAAGPGADTRQWVSNGTVNVATPTAPAVDFTPVSGPLVSVRLHPSDIDVRCRVASFVSRIGETEWHPFAGGDEVVVLLPMGNERSNPIIIGRLNNGVDTFPTTVCGIDVTQNSTTAKKTVANFAWEVSNGWLLRNVETNAQLAMDRTGGWILNSGDLHVLTLNSNGATLGIAKLQSSINFAPSGKVTIAAGSVVQQNACTLTLDPSTGNIYGMTQGALPVGHAASIEGMIGLIASSMSIQGLANSASLIWGEAIDVVLTTFAAATTLLTDTTKTFTSLMVAFANATGTSLDATLAGASTTLSDPSTGLPPLVTTLGELETTLGTLTTAIGALAALVPIQPELTWGAVNAGIVAAGATPPFATFQAAMTAKLALPRVPGPAVPGLGSAGFFV